MCILGDTQIHRKMNTSHRTFILIAAIAGAIRLVGSFQLPQFNNRNVRHHRNTNTCPYRAMEYVPRFSPLSLRALKDIDSGSPNENAANRRKSVSLFRSIQTIAVSAALSLSVLTGGGYFEKVASAAADPNAIVGCLFQKCAVPLAKCIASPKCLANVVCINTCNDRPDEIDCQIRCGDIFDNPAIAEFNKCAVSDMSCVPQQPDNGQYPVPSPEVTVPKFNTNFFNGRLYITAGTFILFLHSHTCSAVRTISLQITKMC
jgi:VDE lipocalin domain